MLNPKDGIVGAPRGVNDAKRLQIIIDPQIDVHRKYKGSSEITVQQIT